MVVIILNCIKMLQRQRCLTTTSVDYQANAIINEELGGRQCSIAAIKLDTNKQTPVHKKRVQRSEGHFDLLGMQIFLYKGRMFAERSYCFIFNFTFLCFNSNPLHALLGYVIG